MRTSISRPALYLGNAVTHKFGRLGFDDSKAGEFELESNTNKHVLIYASVRKVHPGDIVEIRQVQFKVVSLHDGFIPVLAKIEPTVIPSKESLSDSDPPPSYNLESGQFYTLLVGPKSGLACFDGADPLSPREFYTYGDVLKRAATIKAQDTKQAEDVYIWNATSRSKFTMLVSSTGLCSIHDTANHIQPEIDLLAISEKVRSWK